MIDRSMLLIKASMVELATLFIVLDIPGEKIPLVTIFEVGVVGIPDPDTCEVLSMETQ
jgi:hypothetical protein